MCGSERGSILTPALFGAVPTANADGGLHRIGDASFIFFIFLGTVRSRRVPRAFAVGMRRGYFFFLKKGARRGSLPIACADPSEALPYQQRAHAAQARLGPVFIGPRYL